MWFDDPSRAAGVVRAYSLPVWRRVLSYVGLAMLDAMLLSLAVVYPTWPTLLTAVPMAAGFAAFFWRRLDKWRVTESPEGLTCRDPGFGTRIVLPWDDIERFDSAGRRTVMAVKRGGRCELITGLVNAEKMTWDGGETRDIVGELNARLKYWRSQQVLDVGAAAGTGAVEMTSAAELSR